MMSHKFKNPSRLFRFAKTHCANMDGENCLLSGVICLLSERKPCEYFRKAVFPVCDPAYRFANETDQYPKLKGEYDIVYGPSKTQSTRKCQCGAILKKRQRMCEDCRKKRRQETQKRNIRKYRFRV